MAVSDWAIVLSGIVGIVLICLMTLLVCERSPNSTEKVLLLDTFQQHRIAGAGLTPLPDHIPEVGRWFSYAPDPNVPTIYVVDNAGYATSELTDSLNFSPFTSIDSAENELIAETRVKIPSNVSELTTNTPMDILIGFIDVDADKNVAVALSLGSDGNGGVLYGLRTLSSTGTQIDSLTKPLQAFQLASGFEFKLTMTIYKGYVQAWLDDQAGGLSVATTSLDPVTIYDAFIVSLGFFGGIAKSKITYCKASYIHRP